MVELIAFSVKFNNSYVQLMVVVLNRRFLVYQNNRSSMKIITCDKYLYYIILK